MVTALTLFCDGIKEAVDTIHHIVNLIVCLFFRFSCDGFVNRQGRIPAPVHSFKN